MTTEHSYLTVTALTRYLKKKFDADPHLRKVYVKGELSNVKYHSNGHIYFTLKDAGARISCALFASQARHLPFKAEDGMNVFVTGDISLFEAAGNYQLYVKTMEPDGIGALFVAYEQLKKKLEQEGLFDPDRKKPIPKFPLHIGIVTSPTGAAIRDMLTTLERRFPLAKVTVFSALVQGKGAALSIVQAINKAELSHQVDVLIVGRGGGSIEDLWAFNEEPVARAIATSPLPIISAIGHETDTTIADFVADLRAPTPTAAAELAVPDHFQLRQAITDYQMRSENRIAAIMQQHMKDLTKLKQAVVFSQPLRMYRPFLESHVQLNERLERAYENYVIHAKSKFDHYTVRLRSLHPHQKIARAEKQKSDVTSRLMYIERSLITKKQQQFSDLIRTLEALSPLETMRKGFVLTQKEDHLVKSAHQLETGDLIQIVYHDGKAQAVIQSIEKEETHELNI
ncbi:exodeoxyribonuclease VII large subunit [Chryseomicrobium palamuruense]|uniref:Exodeoxyribonuclease 7 large subunit n=1 Tax=Chryseomicrobium palamuruense TaxID=682973 RepID=A0ABV8UYW2_9BACL